MVVILELNSIQRESVKSVAILNLQYHRHDQRPLLRLPRNIAFQVRADLFLDHAVIGFFFFAGVRQRVFNDPPGSIQQAVYRPD